MSFLLVFFAVLLSTQVSNAQIAPGAVIPLDINKAADHAAIKKNLGKCLQEEMLSSMLGIAPNSTLVSTEESELVGEPSGSGGAWTKSAMWTPAFEMNMDFDEWVTPQKSVARTVSISLSSNESYTGQDWQTLYSHVETDAKNNRVSVNLYLDLALPFYQIVSEGGDICSINNWGQNNCTSLEERVTAANLVIPNGFVSTSKWVNRHTYHETQKQFDAFKYAECLLNSW